VNEINLKLGVVCKCILGVSKSSSIIMNIEVNLDFDNFLTNLPELCPFMNLLNFGFPDNNL